MRLGLGLSPSVSLGLGLGLGPRRRRLAGYLPAGALLLARFLGLSARVLRAPSGIDQLAAIFPPGTSFAQGQARPAGTPTRRVRRGLGAWI